MSRIINFICFQGRLQDFRRRGLKTTKFNPSPHPKKNTSGDGWPEFIHITRGGLGNFFSKLRNQGQVQYFTRLKSPLHKKL